MSNKKLSDVELVWFRDRTDRLVRDLECLDLSIQESRIAALQEIWREKLPWLPRTKDKIDAAIEKVISPK